MSFAQDTNEDLSAGKVLTTSSGQGSQANPLPATVPLQQLGAGLDLDMAFICAHLSGRKINYCDQSCETPGNPTRAAWIIFFSCNKTPSSVQKDAENC